jgi:acetyl esterase/lipase
VSRRRLIIDAFTPGQTHRYGPHRAQRAELHLPPGPGPHPVMILIHGGSWQARYGKIVMRGLAGDLARRGWAAWNIEYRRVGDAGGWPATFQDIAAAVDHLADVQAPIDLARVSVLGHSAGGHLALWAAGRENLPQGAPGALDGEPAVILRRAIAQAGVCDLTGAYRLWGGSAARRLMGGGPDELPERYAIGDPMRLLPPVCPVLLVHGISDELVAISITRSYANAASDAGADVELVELVGPDGRHRAHVDPRSAAWAAVSSRLGEPVQVQYERASSTSSRTP